MSGWLWALVVLAVWAVTVVLILAVCAAAGQRAERRERADDTTLNTAWDYPNGEPCDDCWTGVARSLGVDATPEPLLTDAEVAELEAWFNTPAVLPPAPRGGVR